MKDLQHPDTLHLQAAVGWLELGNHLEANEELEKITANLRTHPDVLVVRWRIYAKAEQWANPRVQKSVYWLVMARKEGEKPAEVLDLALALAGYKNAARAKLTKDALLRNLDNAEKFGCLNEQGLAEMRSSKSPTVMKGPYQGDELSVDHIIPRTVVPELDNVIANLELMPLRMNESKNAKIGQRQRDMAKKFYQAGC